MLASLACRSHMPNMDLTKQSAVFRNEIVSPQQTARNGHSETSIATR